MVSSYGARLGSTGRPGCENTLPHSTHCHYQYTKTTSTLHLKLLGLSQPGKRVKHTRYPRMNHARLYV